MKSIHILLVEDNEGDILLTTEALEESKIINKISVIKDGSAAIDFFEQLKDDQNKPDLVLLDINLPKKSGQEVLSHIKKHPLHSRIPVIMLTTSSAERDILLAYKNYANCYITKPVEVSEFISAIAKIQDFWINIVSIPNHK
ncbi:response regulator [Pedobacter sp. Du54]|uniref:response regulator n=1 Tax=Pedobacter anseongensis TaxID=3133439 RepID=UPI0030A742BE